MILSARTLVITGIAAFLLFVIALMPASLALSLSGADGLLRYSAAHGTVWDARLEGARVSGRPLGTVALSLSPLSALAGTLSAEGAFSSPGRSGRFALTRDGDTTRVKDLHLSLDITARVGRGALAGVLSLRDAALAFSGNRCTQADGTFRTNILESGFAGTGVEGPLLTGALVCDGGVPGFRFSGENDFVAISGQGSLTAGARVAADILVAFREGVPVTDDLKLALQFAGLQETTEGWRGQLSLDVQP
jgi:general secretion pathway protein N